MEDCSATQDELMSRNRSYRDLQTFWLHFGGNLATPFFRCENPPHRQRKSVPRAEKKQKNSASVSKIDSPSNVRRSKYGASAATKELRLLIYKITGVGSETDDFCSKQLRGFVRHGELEQSNCTLFTSENGTCILVKVVLFRFTQL